MLDKPQMDAWIAGSSAYCCQPLKGMIDNPIWTADPDTRPTSAASATLRPNGYAGPLGYASAATMADYVMVDMVAEAATGQRTPEERCQARRAAREPLLPGLSHVGTARAPPRNFRLLNERGRRDGRKRPRS